ncbi:MAG TPA: class I SAM-dependent methyltransferase [Chloroflexota bacterium]|nr:class I SAM-dependent methyltransferase [Chloroflexota bacterium]
MSFIHSDPGHRELDDTSQCVRAVLQTLDDLTGIEQIWPRGVVHDGGPHYRLRGTLGPVSLGEDECRLFGRLVEALRPANCFIIGNAFGMSSTVIAKAMERHAGRSVITLDSESEGDGARCHAVAEALRERLECRILTNKVGWSPRDIASAADDESYDLIFIDGDHSHPQVTRDFEGVLPLARDDSVLCWHDYWMAGVPESVEAAQKAGFTCIKVNTSCEMVFGARREDLVRRIASLHGSVEPPRRRSRRAAYLKLYRALALGALKKSWSRARGS